MFTSAAERCKGCYLYLSKVNIKEYKNSDIDRDKCGIYVNVCIAVYIKCFLQVSHHDIGNTYIIKKKYAK